MLRVIGHVVRYTRSVKFEDRLKVYEKAMKG
jgi:hypothetical protein